MPVNLMNVFISEQGEDVIEIKIDIVVVKVDRQGFVSRIMV